MSNDTAPQPNSPTEWQDNYVSSTEIKDIPSKSSLKSTSDLIYSQRDIYLDISPAFKSEASDIAVFADVIAFPDKETIVKVPEDGTIEVYARVLTASSPVHLRFEPKSPSSGGVFTIYASVLDQPFTYSVGSNEAVPLNLGVGSEYVGVQLAIQNNQVNPQYQTKYLDLFSYPPEFGLCLETQLRAASAIFWNMTSVGLSLTSHIATATAHSLTTPLINVQAVSLGQQLAAQSITGPDMSWAPVLQMGSYITTVKAALDAASAFQTQYDRFKDKEGSAEDQKQVWETMIENAKNTANIREVRRNQALSKYDDACETVKACSEELDADQAVLKDVEETFKEGLEAWKRKLILQAVFQIFTAVLSFSFAIGKIFMGGENGAGEISDAVKAIEEAEKEGTEAGKKVTSGTVKKLAESVKVLGNLYPTINTTVTAIKKLEFDPDIEIPKFSDISGTDQGDVDSDAIVTLASWDKWVLESDQQFEFAVAEKIGGASVYRLALRKHAVNGKQLAQAQVEAIKAGQQYIQAQLDVNLSQKDIVNLEDLKGKYQGEEEIYAKAAVKFYDRLISIRTSLVIEMRNLTWAYKYYALEDSSIRLDSQKPIDEYIIDISTIYEEIENKDSRYASDYQPFNRRVETQKLPSNYGSDIVDGLKGSTHSASFTLVPSTSSTPKEIDLAGPFRDGSHFRIEGMEAVLVGATPKSVVPNDDLTDVKISIMTSGVYADIQDDKVYHFTSLPFQRRFEYLMTAAGELDTVSVEASYPTVNHAEPTVFTQWTIKLKEPELLDLSGLTGVKLTWRGQAHFDMRKRDN